MPKDNSPGYTTPASERANTAAHEIMKLFAEAKGEAHPGGELHCRLWKYLSGEFDDFACEVEADCEALARKASA